MEENLIEWLLEGDVAIQYQTHRDLLSNNRTDLQKRIALEGWGAQFMAKQRPDGHWGQKFYQPKWISTHYTLLDLKNLYIQPDHPKIRNIIEVLGDTEKGKDGGILPVGPKQTSELCVSGMFLNYAAYFKTPEVKLESVVDFILSQHMPDGGFNCHSNRIGARHSSLHTTLSVLEGFTEYLKNSYQYRKEAIEKAQKASIEFVLMHRLFLSDHTGKIIRKDFLKLAYPGRWKYDILRALDYFQYSGTNWDERMREAIDVLLQKRSKDGTWKLPSRHSGQVHFEMETAGKPSRWNTLRALRVLKHFEEIN